MRLTQFPRRLVFAAALLIATAIAFGPVNAQQATAQARQNADDFVLLTYDVNDLVLNVPDYPYTQGNQGARGIFGAGYGGGGMGMLGGMGGMGGSGGTYDAGGGQGGFGGAPNVSGPGGMTGRITMMDLTRVIVAVIARETWSETADGLGELQVLGTSLVVRQTPAVHQQIEDLLSQLRKNSGKGRTVVIDARWLLLDSDDLEKLLPTPAAEKEAAQVDRAVLAEYTRRPSSIRGITNCFTGQLVYLVSGTRQSVVTGVVPVVGSLDGPRDSGTQYASRGASVPNIVPIAQFGAYQGVAQMGGGMTSDQATSSRSVGYQPVVDRPNFGALLEIRPTLIPDGNSAIVDLHSTITIPGESTLKAGIQPRQSATIPAVDRLAIDTQELATTLSVPLGEPVLVGGLTYIAPATLALTPTPTAGATSPQPLVKETPQLYLILELRPGVER